MTISAGIARVQYTGTATPSTGPFAFNFTIFEAAHLAITRTSALGTDTTLALTTDFSVTIATDYTSATVTLVAALTAGEKITLVLDPPIEQQADYPRNDAFPAATHERALDLLTQICTRLSEKLGRALLLPESSGSGGLTVPTPAAAEFLRWNATATALENAGVTLIPAAFPSYGTSDRRKVLGVAAASDALAFVPRLYDVDGALVSTGTGAAYAVATTYPYSVISDAKWLRVKLHTANTGACSLTPDGLPAGLPIKLANGSDPVAGQLVSGGVYDFVNTGTAFQVVNASAPLDVVGLTEDILPDVAADFLLSYDTSATVNKKVLHSRVGTGRQTMFIPGAALTQRATNGAAAGAVELATNKIQLKTLDFDTTTQEFAQFMVAMPKGWNRGTVTARFRWSHAATTTNFGVVWAIEAVAVSDGDALDAAFGTAQQIADTGGTTNTQYTTDETPAVTVGGSPLAADTVIFQVKRVPADAGDTLAVDARLHGVELFYTTAANTDN